MKRWDERVLALAGVFQAAALVDSLAQTGRIDSEHLSLAVNCLFDQNPESVTALLGSTDKVDLGLEKLCASLNRQNTRSTGDYVNYVMSLLHLQRKLLKRSDMLEVISQRLQQSRHQLEHFGPTHENTIASLASIYSDTISTFQFRIQVKGNYDYLRQDRIAAQVRLLLFFGIRMAVLWRQVGGKKRQIVFNRKTLTTVAEQLRQQTTVH